MRARTLLSPTDTQFACCCSFFSSIHIHTTQHHQKQLDLGFQHYNLLQTSPEAFAARSTATTPRRHISSLALLTTQVGATLVRCLPSNNDGSGFVDVPDSNPTDPAATNTPPSPSTKSSCSRMVDRAAVLLAPHSLLSHSPAPALPAPTAAASHQQHHQTAATAQC